VSKRFGVLGFVLGIFGTLGPATPAFAQAGAQAPPPPPPAAPPAEPPAAPTGLLGRFAGSYISWDHVVNVELLGVGDKSLDSTSFAYSMSWSFAPSFYVYRSDRHALRLQTSLGVSVELTNSETTTENHQPLLGDLPITLSDAISLFSWGGQSAAPQGPSAAFDPSLVGGGEFNTWLVTSAGLVLPTSKKGQTAFYAATRLGLGLRQRVKLLGSQAPGLQNVTLSLNELWRHDFNRSNVPTSSNAHIPRQDATGTLIVSDVISGALLTTDRLSTSVEMILPLYAGLELSGEFAYRVDFRPALTQGSCVQLATGCVDPAPAPSGARTFSYTRFDLALAYRVLPELTVDIGYDTFAPSVRANGGSANPVYQVGDSVFYADVALFPEALLRRFFRPAAPASTPASR